MLAEIDAKMNKTKKTLKQLNYVGENFSAKEFHDYMTGEIFSENVITLSDVLDNELLMIHELMEIGELKKTGMAINKRTIVESPKTMIYEAHFTAMEHEFNFALLRMRARKRTNRIAE